VRLPGAAAAGALSASSPARAPSRAEDLFMRRLFDRPALSPLGYNDWRTGG
jgi:hypothetical protein